MAKSVLLGLFLLHGMIANRVAAAVAGVIAQTSTRNLPVVVNVTLAFALLREVAAGENCQRAVQSELLLPTSSSWDGEPYKSYPSGQPELSILKITLAPHAELEERLAFAKILIRGIRKDFMDVTGVARLHGGKACFINRDTASDVDLVFDDSAFHTPPVRTPMLCSDPSGGESSPHKIWIRRYFQLLKNSFSAPQRPSALRSNPYIRCRTTETAWRS